MGVDTGVGADACAWLTCAEGVATEVTDEELGWFDPELAAAAAIEMMMIKAIRPPQPMARLRPRCPFFWGIAVTAAPPGTQANEGVGGGGGVAGAGVERVPVTRVSKRCRPSTTACRH